MRNVSRISHRLPILHACRVYLLRAKRHPEFQDFVTLTLGDLEYEALKELVEEGIRAEQAREVESGKRMDARFDPILAGYQPKCSLCGAVIVRDHSPFFCSSRCQTEAFDLYAEGDQEREHG